MGVKNNSKLRAGIIILSKGQMGKIRKQPRRSTKKTRIPSLRNPFREQTPLLPQPIAENLKNLELIVLRHLDEILCEPPETPEANIDMMKLAFSQQQSRINGLKVHHARKKSITQAQEHDHMKEVIGHHEQRSSNQLLEYPVQANNLDWMLHQHQSIDFF